MKKQINGIILLLTFCVILTACATAQKETKIDAATSTIQTSQPSAEQKPRPSAGQMQQLPTKAEEGSDINPYDSDAGVPFYVDESFLSELPAAGISVYDALDIIVETLHPEAEFLPPYGYTMLYMYNGIIDIDGEAFYCIDFGADSEYEFLVERTFAVSLAGVLYEGVPYTDAYAPYELYAAHYDVKGDDMEPISEEDAISCIEYALYLMDDSCDFIWRDGEDYIDGEYCITYTVGKSSEDGTQYSARYYFAVSESGVLYFKDYLQGPDWILFYDAQ